MPVSLVLLFLHRIKPWSRAGQSLRRPAGSRLAHILAKQELIRIFPTAVEALLVELHQGAHWKADAMVKDLEARFRTSHSISFIPIKRRDPSQFSSVCQGLSAQELERSLDEDRSGSFGWLVFKTLF